MNYSGDENKLSLVVVALCAGLLVGCEQEQAATDSSPPVVGVYVVQAGEMTTQADLPGRARPYRIAEVRPQVNGVVQKRLFVEGVDVKQGQQLYQIDPAIYQAAYDRAEANLYSTEKLAARYQQLENSQSISKQQLDDALAAKRLALADLQTAKINLQFTKVFSPISGRIGRSVITEGALVTNGQAQALAVVQQLDPIYVDITQSTRDILRLRKAMESGKLKSVGNKQAAVTLTLEDGSEYPLQGTLNFSEVSVDEETGSVILRATFPNPDKKLLPGMFVHAHLQEGMVNKAILVPQQAVARNYRGQAIVMVVDGDGTAHERVVETDRTVGNYWLVSSGIIAGEQVITEGLQRARDGVKVKAEAASNLKPVQVLAVSAAE
ncbi:efflux RND transporter periplasmic adaptor subunit [Methylobacillus sp.]|uniref:efflux RND transporter periplasmic adaptor subunit n=1 Tax=Methylobacillus sp. TaxID=56818 RepID=UPI0012C15C5C|nr:efflux RND transporter periplasmic adaptor subunit [Methylobacillus sp.]MPS47584.1 efflux RND transporter periplasmic adaptor subunit [Methylobacillus sp.]